MKIFCVLFVMLVACASAKHVSFKSELELRAYEEVKTIYSVFQDAMATKSGAIKSRNYAEKGSSRRLGKFIFTNCGDPTKETAVLSNFTLKPDPVKIPGSIQVAGQVLIKSGFSSPLDTTLKVWKEILGNWIEIPCIDNFGSCNYPDFCKIDNPSTCPPEFVKIGLPCKCPFTAGNWNLPPVTFDIPNALPISITGGVRARLSGTYNGNLVTCVQVEFDLS